MVPLAKNQTVCFGIMSYNGGMNFGVTADYDSMPDLDALAEDLEVSMAELSEAASAEGGDVPEPRRRKRRFEAETQQKV
jgi:diacylglycerol O-acyltransferase